MEREKEKVAAQDYVPVLFSPMSAATHTDIAASDACPPRRLQAGRRRTGHPSLRLGRWLAKLALIGTVLVRECRNIAQLEWETGRPSRVDMPRLWDLVSRAACWTHALKLRLKAQRRPVPRTVLDRGEDADEMIAAVRRARELATMGTVEREMRQALHHGRAEAVTEIAELKTAEVVARICDDLTEASALLDLPGAQAWVAEIAARLRTVLEEVGDAADATPLPPETPTEVYARVMAEYEELMAAVDRPLSDTG